MRVVREMPGHSSITFTVDTCASVMPQVARTAARAAARLSRAATPRRPRPSEGQQGVRIWAVGRPAPCRVNRGPRLDSM